MFGCGIVGLPNAGKSTLFNALLQKQVAFAANYPFATIAPNVGVVPVPDERLPQIAKLVNTAKIVPATVEFVDIAGLVAGAHKGEGLGNQFLSHIREVDLIAHVVRAFRNPDVVHVAGEVDFKRDIGIIETELMMADLATLEKQTQPRGVLDREVVKRWEIISQLKAALNQGRQAIDVVAPEDRQHIQDLHLLTLKPVLYVLNVSENDLINYSSSGPHREKGVALANLIKSQLLPQNDIVVISAKIEAELAALTQAEQKEYLKHLGLATSGLERLIQKAYAKLGLISFLTGGEKETRAWTVKQGTKAPQAAGVIHTDFEKGFIKAEIVTYDEFVAARGWAGAREQGKVRLEGRDYVMQDGDVVDFKVNA